MYQICFLWKLSQGFIEGNSVNWQLSERRGRYVIPNRIPRNAPSIVEKARERSMGVHGAHICNILTVLGPKKLVSPDSPHPPFPSLVVNKTFHFLAEYTFDFLIFSF